jgi:2-polyprenyl-6-methoxyphenol hydroxylase-like FAD-dependent oxidoreductase
MQYDVIVVGARCAGSAAAMLLARQGHRVLMIDQGSFPSDVRLSTHLIWHAGVDLLDQWGLLDAVKATDCPLLTRLTLDLGGVVIQGHPPGTTVGAAMAPRRFALDQVLLDAALSAGAELRERTTFEGVVREGDRVVGITARDAHGTPITLSCRMLIGADGRTSPVARAVDAASYNEVPKEQGAFNCYAYFSGVDVVGAEFISRPERMIYAWNTNGGQTLVGCMQPGQAPRPSREDLASHMMAELDALAPDLAQRVRQGRREEEWLGASIATLCRQATGPGWCLLGDAGMTLDPYTAAGISIAFREADHLAARLHRGLSGQLTMDDALAGLEDERNAFALPLYHFSQQAAQLAPPPEEIVQLFGALVGNQPQIDRYFGIFAHTVAPGDFFSPENMQAILADHAARQAENDALTPD